MSTEAARPHFCDGRSASATDEKAGAAITFGTAIGFTVANALDWPAALLTHHVHPAFGRVTRAPDAGIAAGVIALLRRASASDGW
jgi:hypothetical protein